MAMAAGRLRRRPEPGAEVEPQAQSARRKGRILRWSLILLILALAAAIRVAAPLAGRRVLNGRTAGLGGYALHVSNVDLRLLQAAYVLEDVAVRRSSGGGASPILRADRLISGVDWRSAFRHPLAAKLEAVAPRLILVRGADSGGTELGSGLAWDRLLARLAFPRVERVYLRDGEVSFRDLGADPVVELTARAVRIRGEHLLPAGGAAAFGPEWTAHGLIQGSGVFFLGLSLAPPMAEPGFVLDAFLHNLDLRDFGPALKAYADMDDARGWMDISLHVVATADGFTGRIRSSLRLSDTPGPQGAEGALIGMRTDSEFRDSGAVDFSGRFPDTVRSAWARSGFLFREALRHAHPADSRR